MAYSQTLSTYGTPGLVDIPTAEALPDGHLAITTNRFAKISRNTLTFQVLPRLSGTFRYSILRDFSLPSGNLYDRSFDLQYQLLHETDRRPGVAIGLRDFGGTGIAASEYVVATKSIGGRFKVTGGIGWGRLAQTGSFSNPLSTLDDSFDVRPSDSLGGQAFAGRPDFGAWFRGRAAFFGGVEYQATKRLSFQLEYSSDAYDFQVQRGVIDIASPINVGLNYSYPSGSNLRAFITGGREVGLQYTLNLNPKSRRVPGGFDKAPLPMRASGQALLSTRDLTSPDVHTQAESALKRLLASEGMELQGFSHSGAQASVRIHNNRWDIEAQAAGRAARAMAAVLPAHITRFAITFQTKGVPITTVKLNRNDLETLAEDYDGSWKTLTRARFEDPHAMGRDGELAETFPKFSFGLGPYTAFSFFDPDNPVRYDLGVELSASYRPLPGLTFSGIARYPFVGNIADATRTSNSVIQRVRSDAVRYAQESDLEIQELTAEYMFRPGENLFGRATVGYLEAMYAGVSGELLWFPNDSRLALGVELNYVKQRDFDMLFGLQNYEVLTGHASAYYDFGNGFTTQLDVGRYLAGDLGATLSVDREFKNGFKVGAYATLTDVPFSDFGEGSFDKGIRVSVPFSWLSGQPSRKKATQVIQPVLRDGGARLNVSNRLYGEVRDYRSNKLSDGWGRFYR
ncbi:YjbH domain-containing protein [Planktotalea sp.]|uniref:YjbH domain-containing protein n=1 Tax=Planktotalea sp. TaxID=2029877 RepID=UPI0032987D6E